MLKGEYTRTELGVKRGNIQWKVTVNDVILLFVNEGLGNKPESTYMYANHLDIEKDILYMCRDTELTPGKARSGRRFLGTNGATLWLWSCLPKPGAQGP